MGGQCDDAQVVGQGEVEWMQQRQALVEVEKEGVEKGTYQHAEFYGQPKEKGLNYDATRERERKEIMDSARPEPERRP